MNINSVKLVNSGLKGIVVTYANPSNKDNRTFIDEHVSKKKAPIHSELEEAFDELSEILLEICGYASPSSVKNLVEVTGITYNDKGFVITGKYSVLGGDKTINLVTPLIKDEEEYEGFTETTKIMDRIYTEVKAYMAGEKTFNDTQLVMKFNSDKDDFDAETFKSLSAEEQKEIASKILEDLGCIVFHPETEITEEEIENVTKTVTESVKEEEEESWDDVEPVKEEKPKMKVVAKKSAPLKAVVEEGGFKIVEDTKKAI